MERVKVNLHHNEGFEVTFGYLVDNENAIIFYWNNVYLAKVSKREDGSYHVTAEYPMSLLGEQKSLENPAALDNYVESLVKKLKTTSLFDYIVQKHFYLADQDINFDVTGI